MPPPIEVVGSGRTQTIACNDQDVLRGALNTITLTGTSNSVGWSRSLDGGTPRLGTSGANNRVFHADDAPVEPPAELAEPLPLPDVSPGIDVLTHHLLDSDVDPNSNSDSTEADVLNLALHVYEAAHGWWRGSNLPG
jgi:hypothetical protein